MKIVVVQPKTTLKTSVTLHEVTLQMSVILRETTLKTSVVLLPITMSFLAPRLAIQYLAVYMKLRV